LLRADREGSGVPPPGPSPSPSCAFYIVTASVGADEGPRSWCRHFVRFPRKKAGGDRCRSFGQCAKPFNLGMLIEGLAELVSRRG